MTKKYYSPAHSDAKGNKISLKIKNLSELTEHDDPQDILDIVKLNLVTLKNIVSQYERLLETPNIDVLLPQKININQIQRVKKTLDFVTLAAMEVSVKEGKKND